MSMHVTQQWQDASGTFPFVYLSTREHPLHTGGPDRFVELRKRISTDQPAASDSGDALLINSIPKLMSVRGGKLWLKTMETRSQQNIVVELAETGPPFAPLDSPDFRGDPTAPTPPLGDNDTSIATTAFVQGELKADFPSVEDWRGTAGDSSDTGTLLAAIAAAKAAGGMQLRVPARYYDLQQTLVIDDDHISLTGQGAGWYHPSNAILTLPQTRFLWNGAVGGTMVKFTSPASGYRKIGGGLRGIQLDGNVFLAARGLELEGWMSGVFENLVCFACSESQIRLGVPQYAMLGGTPGNTQSNVFRFCVATTVCAGNVAYNNSMAHGWHLTGGSPAGGFNTCTNSFYSCDGYVSKGISWKLENCDDNWFYYITGGAAFDNAQYGLELGSSDQDSAIAPLLGLTCARHNAFFACLMLIHARSTQTAGLDSSQNNIVFAHSRANAIPRPTIEAPGVGAIGATLSYWDTTGNASVRTLGLWEDIAVPTTQPGLAQLFVDVPLGPILVKRSDGSIQPIAGIQGDWTPVFSFATPGDSVITHTVQVGKYFRMGQFVFVIFDIQFNTNAYTTAAGNAQIDGLPFAGFTGDGGLAITYLTRVTFAAATNQMHLLVVNTTTRIEMKLSATDAVIATATVANFPASKTAIRIAASGLYWANA